MNIYGKQQTIWYINLTRNIRNKLVYICRYVAFRSEMSVTRRTMLSRVGGSEPSFGEELCGDDDNTSCGAAD